MTDVTDELLGQGVITVIGHITEQTSKDFIEKMMYLNSLESLEEIIILINSGGGCLPSTFLMINMIKMSYLPVRTIGMGHVSSGAFLLFITGDKRVLFKETVLLSHQLATGMRGNYADIKSVDKYLNFLHGEVLKHCKDYSNLKSIKEVEKYLIKSTDEYLTPKEAIKLGLADSILDKMVVKKEKVRKSD